MNANIPGINHDNLDDINLGLPFCARLQPEHGAMAVDLFAERLAKIRTRFAANLPGKLDSVDNVLPQIAGGGAAAIEALAVTHRSIHELCGTAPSVGFVATGHAARSVEQILIKSLREKRGLTDPEVASVRQELAALRIAARNELQAINGPSE